VLASALCRLGKGEADVVNLRAFGSVSTSETATEMEMEGLDVREFGRVVEAECRRGLRG